MPCFDAEAAEHSATSSRELQQRDAMLCAVLGVLENSGLLKEVLLGIDGGASGVTPTEVAVWYDAHRAHDAARNAGPAPGRR